jgi:hypothetical protein
MNVQRPEPSMADRPPVFASLALLFGGIALYAAIWELLDPPPTWNRCAPPPPLELAELSERRNDFLLMAVPLVAAYGSLVAMSAWKWATRRRLRQGYERRPGHLAYGALLVLGMLWVYLLGEAFISGKVGGAILWGFFLAAGGVVVSALFAIAVIFAGAFRTPTRSRSEDVIDALSVGLTWSILLFGIPVLVIGLAVPGNDGTLWC